MVYDHFAIEQTLRNSAPHSKSTPVDCQTRLSAADTTPAVHVASNNWRWCTGELGNYRVSEDGCLIFGDLS